MRKSMFLLSALTVIVIAIGVAWLVFSGRVAFLTLDRRLRIEVNGMPVQGNVFRNKVTAIVAIRDAGNKHSYQLFFEGDTDFTGDMGSVVDTESLASACGTQRNVSEGGKLHQGFVLGADAGVDLGRAG